MDKNSKILIIGHDDIIENSLYGYFQKNQFANITSSSHASLDLLNQSEVNSFLAKIKPEYVFLSSVRSGGIVANQNHPAEFIYENLQSQNNVIHAAYINKIKKLLFLNSSCTYPRECPQPMKEEYLLTAPLEKTSQPYSIAKLAGVELVQAYRRQYKFNAIVATPATVYGPGSDTDIEKAHVIGALIGKFHHAIINNLDEVSIWGSGKAKREFLFADDFVNAALFLMDNYEDESMINIGCGEDVSIKELAETIKEISGFKGKLIFDAGKPDGTMQKLLDHSRISGLGWKPKTDLREGIRRTYQWYKEKQKTELTK